MKTSLRIVVITLGLCAGITSWAQPTLPPSGNNQKSETTQYMGLVKVTINYSSPDVAGREIWGKLVPYGLTNLGFGTSSDANPGPWRAGANEITTISFSHDVEVEGKPLKAGTYGLHMITGQSEWTIIFSSNTLSWGSFFYNPKEDVLRVTVKPTEAEFNEWLTYEFTDRQQNSCTVQLKWEKLAVPFKLSVPNGDDLYLKKVREELTSNKGFNWLIAVSAVNWMANKKLNLEEAQGYMQNFIDRGVKYYPIYAAKANVQTAAGKQAEADATMKEAIALPDATVGQIVGYGRFLITNNRPKDAMVVFEAANKRFPNTSAALLGLARGYNANGDNKKALKFAQDAYKVETNPQFKATIDGLVKKLEKGESIN